MKINVLVAGFLIVALLGVVTPSNAQSATPWATENVPTNGFSLTNAAIATNGEDVGVAFGISTGRVYFALRTAGAAWALKSADVTATTADPISGGHALVSMGGTTWALATYGSTGKIFLSTNNGATWAQAYTGGLWQNGASMVPTGGTGLAISYLGFASYVGFRYSTDSGTTWTTEQVVNDNRGGAGTPTASVVMRGTPDLDFDGTTYSIAMRSNTAPYPLFLITSTDAVFWTTPYTTNGGSTTQPYATQCNGANPGAIFNNGPYNRGGRIATEFESATKQYECVETALQTFVAVPSATPTNSLNQLGLNYAATRVGQSLLALQDLTANNVKIYYRATVTGTYAEVLSIAPSASAFALAMTPTYGYFVYTDGATGQVKAARSLVYVVPSPALSISVPTLTGFSVDPTGNVVIARTNGQVLTYSGGTLSATGSATTNCAIRPHGVYAISTHVLYIHCDADDDTVVDSFNIRSPSLTAPTGQPNVCEDAGFCIADIPDGGATGQLAGNHDPDAHLVGFNDFPISYLNFKDGTADADAVYMAFAFTTSVGDVGVVSYVMRNNGIDESDLSTQNIGGGQQPDSLCVVKDTVGATAGQSFLYASSIQSNVRGYRVDFSLDGLFESGSHLIPTLVPVFPGTSTTAAARGVACGEGKFAILNTDKLTLWNRGAGTPYKTITGLGGIAPANGITMSADGKWTSYVDATNNIHFVNMTSGAVLNTTYPRATGNFVSLGMQGHGCALWDSSTTTIERFDLIGVTCGSDLAYAEPGNGIDGGLGNTTDGGANHNGPNADTSGSTFISITAADGLCLVCSLVNTADSISLTKSYAYIAGFIFLAACVFGAFALAKRNNASLSGPVSGAILGIGMGGAYVLFLFPLAIIILAALISGSALVMGMRRGTGA